MRSGQRSAETRRAKRDAAVPAERTCAGCGKAFDPRKPKGQTRARMIARRFCSRECAFANDVEDVIVRIFREVETNRLTGCWVWTGRVQRSGHGVIGRGRRGEGTGRVHRIVYEELRGPLDAEVVLHHECLVPRCCNPAHLTPMACQAEHMKLHAARRKH